MLPLELDDCIRAFAETGTVSPAMAFPAFLVAFATASQHCSVEVVESWIQQLSIYTSVIADSGVGKSPILREVSKPLKRLEKCLRDSSREKHHRSLAEYDRLKRLYDKSLSCSQNDGTTIAEARLELENHEIVPLTILLAENTTPEGLTLLIAEQKRLGILSPEGGDLFRTLIGVGYGSGKASPSLEVLVKGIDGDSIRVNRAMRGTQTIEIEAPALSVCLMAQHELLEQVQRHPEVSDRGLTSRFLWVIPPSTVGTRPAIPPAIPKKFREWFDGQIEKLFALPPTQLKLNSGARRVYIRYAEELEKMLGGDNCLEPFQVSWLSKSKGTVARIAALFALLHDRTAVKEVDMTQAVNTMKWLYSHFKLVAARLSSRRSQPPLAHRLFSKLATWNKHVVTTRDFIRNHKSKTASKAEILAALELLCELGALRPTEQSGHFEVHPDITD